MRCTKFYFQPEVVRNQNLQLLCYVIFFDILHHYGVIAASQISVSRKYYAVLRKIFFFLLFSATILSGPYLWNRYSQRLQIECAAWSCCLILHHSLPSNSLRYFFYFLFFLFFRQDFVAAISLEPSLVETPDRVCCLVLLSNFALLLTIQFALLFYFFLNFFLFFRHNFVRAISLEPLLAETPN